jgi:hypothetical protein
MSHPDDVGVSRQYDHQECTYILSLDCRTVWHGVHRETDMDEFFCECVNSMRMRVERRCAYGTD